MRSLFVSFSLPFDVLMSINVVLYCLLVCINAVAVAFVSAPLCSCTCVPVDLNAIL